METPLIDLLKDLKTMSHNAPQKRDVLVQSFHRTVLPESEREISTGFRARLNWTYEIYNLQRLIFEAETNFAWFKQGVG